MRTMHFPAVAGRFPAVARLSRAAAGMALLISAMLLAPLPARAGANRRWSP